MATLAALMLLVQAVCWLLARGLGLRLSKWAVLGGWIAPLVVLWPWLSGNPLLVSCDILGRGVPGAPTIERSGSHDLLNDTVYQLLPWELEVRHALSDRRLPFWSDALEGGSSPWANPQAGALSPLQMAARALPIQHHLLGTLALKMLVAFQGTWLLARLAGRSRASSLLAAAGFTLGGGLFSWAVFPVTAAAAWVPWMAAGTIRLFRHPGRRMTAGIATTAIITGILLLSGHPETAAFGGLFAAVCGLCLRRKTTGIRRGFAAAALAAMLGFGLAAPLILPFLAIVPDSQRARDTLAEKLPSGYVSLHDPLSWFVPGYGQFFLSPISPHVYGRPYQDPFHGPFNWADAEAGYTGLVAFAGALIALLAARDRRAWPFLGFAIASLLLAARFLPLSALLQLVPILKVPAYSRCLIPGSLALCVAGAFGVDLLFGHGQGGRVRARREVLAWAGLGLAALFSLWAVANAWTVGLWIALAAAFAVGRLTPRWGLHLGAVALGAVLLTDLIPWSRSLLPQGHPAHFYPKTEIMDIIVQEAGDPAVGRGTGGDYLIYPNLLPVYGVADFRPHNPLAPARLLEVLGAGVGYHPRMNEYFAPVRNVDHPLIDFLGVRVVLGSPAVSSRTLTRIDGGRFPPYTLYRNPDPLPRWFFPEAVDRIGRGEAEGWIAKLDNPRRVAVFADEAGSWQPAAGQAAPPRVLSSSPGRVVLEMPDGGEKLLASSVPWSRGWSARGDGRRLSTLVINGAFLGARVPAGVSRIELGFVPPGFVPGVAVFAVSALAVLLLLVRPPRRAV